jgi:two-component SAPR family response regulator
MAVLLVIDELGEQMRPQLEDIKGNYVYTCATVVEAQKILTEKDVNYIVCDLKLKSEKFRNWTQTTQPFSKFYYLLSDFSSVSDDEALAAFGVLMRPITREQLSEVTGQELFTQNEVDKLFS